MNRNLITQIKNEWRENLWLCIELVIVSVAVWILSLVLFTTLRPKFEEKGFEITNVYKLNINTIPSSSPEYAESENPEADKASDIRALLARIRRSPYVELAGLSRNAIPYQFNYFGNRLKFKGLPDTIVFNGNVRTGSPELARILQIKSPNHSPEELEEILRKDEYLIADASAGYMTRNEKLDITSAKSLLGRYAYFGDDSVNAHRAGAIIAPIKRNEYEMKGSDIFVAFQESDDKSVCQAMEIAILVKPDMGKKFEDEFFTSSDMRRMRNVYLTELTDMEKRRESNQRYQDTQVRLTASGIFFLFIIIFLGLLGTFWFRIRQRTGEIALRKTCGATSSDIFRRIISEGLILLLLAMIPAIIADGLLTHYLLRDYSFSMSDYSFSWIPASVAFVISFAAMCVMIVIGVWFPARQAMKVEPAIALKDE